MSSHDAVVRAIDVVEEGLDRHLTVAELADAAGYSLFHFCRVFARCTRMSPYTYLIRRRLTLAADDVLGSLRRIVDIGTGLGFDTHDGFTRAFTRLYGVTPSEARQVGDVAVSRRLPRLTEAHLACLERHGGLVATWPDAVGPPGGSVRTAAFMLADGVDLPLVLDWLHHVWVVAERLDLVGRPARVERVEPARTVRVLLPVVPWVPGAARAPTAVDVGRSYLDQGGGRSHDGAADLRRHAGPARQPQP